MLEIEDSKLGRIKFINVTECRTHISKIMMDTTCNYVITKNNTPIRVIINYDVFQGIQEGEKAKTGKISDSKTLLKGLIEVTEKELKSQAAKRQKDKVLDPVPEKVTIVESNDLLVEPPPVIEEVIVPPPAAAKPEPVLSREEADYFERFKKLYDSTPHQESVVKVHEPRPLSPSVTQYSKDPPSIQDLLRDLDQERLSQEQRDQAAPADDLGELLKRLSAEKQGK